MPETAPLTTFERHWLAETLRLHEAEHGGLDDTALLPALQRAASDVETRILLRAERLTQAQHPSWIDDMRAWKTQARWVIGLLAALALLSGFFSATSLINTGMYDTGGRLVNVVWMLCTLLLPPILTLLAWLFLLALPGTHGQTLLGQFGVWLQRHLPGQSPARLHVGHALFSLLNHHRLLRWGMGSLSHLLWLIALSAAVLGLLFMLATQQHLFVWETTILPGEVFVNFVTWTGTLPAYFGFTTPSPEVILASGTSHTTQSEFARHAWASWLLGCVIVYGLLPRLLALVFSFWQWKHGLAKLRLDLKQPGLAMLRARLHVETQNIGIIDPAPATLHTSTFHPWPSREHSQGTKPILIGLELGEDIPWPPVGSEKFMVFPRIDSGEDRQRLLAALQKTPPNSLLIVVDTRVSPDRGSLNLINQWAQLTEIPLVWLMQPPSVQTGVQIERSNIWRESLREAGWPKDALLDDASAKIWLTGGAA
jgi:hypothetical protein